MSFYATMRGELQYQTDESFDRIATMLKDAGWVDDEGYFLSEDDERSANVCVDPSTRTIDIPYGTYLNLSRVPFVETTPPPSGYVVGASTDGCFEGWTERGDGKTVVKECHDLNEWAEQNDCDEPPVNDDGDDDQYYQDLTDWRNEILDAYLDI